MYVLLLALWGSLEAAIVNIIVEILELSVGGSDEKRLVGINHMIRSNVEGFNASQG